VPGSVKSDSTPSCGVTAKAGTADYLVTGDEDLLILEKYEQVAIIRPADFLQVLRDEGLL